MRVVECSVCKKSHFENEDLYFCDDCGEIFCENCGDPYYGSDEEDNSSNCYCQSCIDYMDKKYDDSLNYWYL